MENIVINLKLLELTKTGTLERTFVEKTQVASDDYIQSLLRMTPEEKMGCQRSQSVKEGYYLEKIWQIQDEILHTPIQDISAGLFFLKLSDNQSINFVASSNPSKEGPYFK